MTLPFLKTFPIYICFLALLVLTGFRLPAQSYVTKDIKSFGAKGDGKTDDHAAFERAANYFNKRGGRGKLVISPGTFLVGKQHYTKGEGGKPAYLGADLLRLSGVKDMVIEGSRGSRIRYKDGLRFGAFNPKTGKAHEHGNNYFVKGDWAAIIGHCIFLDNARNVSIRNLELDGNNGKVILGGVYGDVGRQLPHYGIFIRNSKSITVEGVKAHHFALDGICVSNKASDTEDDIKLLNSAFEYNSRQGLSWIGGNDLKVKGCKFNYTGQGAFASNPGAGLDIEAEVGPVRNGKFENCEFINNKGAGMVADSGDGGYCEFKECTFWGVDSWAVWVRKPGFRFEDCTIYGSVVHGYNARTDKEATQFIDCHFEDKPYQGKEPHGNFLVESNGVKRMSFTGSSFVTHKMKVAWLQLGKEHQPEEKYQFTDCRFTMYNDNLGKGDFIAVIRGIRYRDCTFEFKSKEAKKKGYYLNDCCGPLNTDAGGNKVVYAETPNP
jgi:hypothetical protein